jgi:hypothetical protein
MANKFGIPETVLAEIAARDRQCVYCQKVMLYPYKGDVPHDSATIEHLNFDGPFYWGRGLRAADIVMCCGSCNSSRGRKTLPEWFAWLRGKSPRRPWRARCANIWGGREDEAGRGAPEARYGSIKTGGADHRDGDSLRRQPSLVYMPAMRAALPGAFRQRYTADLQGFVSRLKRLIGLRREHWHAQLRRPGSEPPMPSAPAGAGDQGITPHGDRLAI